MKQRYIFKKMSPNFPKDEHIIQNKYLWYIYLWCCSFTLDISHLALNIFFLSICSVLLHFRVIPNVETMSNKGWSWHLVWLQNEVTKSIHSGNAILSVNEQHHENEQNEQTIFIPKRPSLLFFFETLIFFIVRLLQNSTFSPGNSNVELSGNNLHPWYKKNMKNYL